MTRASTRPKNSGQTVEPNPLRNQIPEHPNHTSTSANSPSLIVRLPLRKRISTPATPKPQPPPLQDLWCARIVIGWDSGREPAALCAKETLTQSTKSRCESYELRMYRVICLHAVTHPIMLLPPTHSHAAVPAIPPFANEEKTFSPTAEIPYWDRPMASLSSTTDSSSISLDASELLSPTLSTSFSAPISFPSPSHSEVPSLDSNLSSSSTSSTISIDTPPPLSNVLESSTEGLPILDSLAEWDSHKVQTPKLEQDANFWSVGAEEETKAIGWTW